MGGTHAVRCKISLVAGAGDSEILDPYGPYGMLASLLVTCG